MYSLKEAVTSTRKSYNDKILEVNEIDCNRYSINKDLLLNNYTHHTIRLKNILRVILNDPEMGYHPMLKEYPLEDGTRLDKDDQMFGR